MIELTSNNFWQWENASPASPEAWFLIVSDGFWLQKQCVHVF